MNKYTLWAAALETLRVVTTLIVIASLITWIFTH